MALFFFGVSSMHADSHFVIGHEHTVCQDYAACWQTETGVVAAMADGCSTAPDTDVGARLLVLLAKQHQAEGLDSLEDKIIESLPTPPGAGGLDWRAYRATLGIVSARPEGASVRLWGDGVVIAVRHTGEVEAEVVNYDEGAPPYLCYKKLPEEIAAWGRLSKQGAYTVESISQGTSQTRRGENPELKPLSLEYLAETYKVVAVCSDGLMSAYSPSGPVPVSEMVSHLGSLPNLSGEFVVRKLRNGLSKFLKKANAVHADDVSMAAVVLDEGI